METAATLEWSPQQQAALRSVQAWLEDEDQQVYRLFGYAGTGKTTLAKHLATGVGGTVLFGAYTGKAAYVLRQRGCLGAMTIHKMIYRPKDKSKARLRELQTKRSSLEAELEKAKHLEQADESELAVNAVTSLLLELDGEIKREVENLKRPLFSLDLTSVAKDASLIVIDEVSMVGAKMGQDLCSFGQKLLVLGDPAQLPPVGDGGFFTGARPDTMLEEIHRQAEGSPIIAMATRVRRGEGLPMGEYGEGCSVLPKGTLSLGELAEADIVLAGRNVTRTKINHWLREHLGFGGPTPQPGERLVCLRNNHEIGVLNGEVWNVVACEVIDEDRVWLTLEGDDSERVVDTEAHRHHFDGRELPWYDRREADEFTYGYCLTVHKSQGSQWDDVIVVDESQCFREDARKWLYTAVTRAAKRVRITR
jgi:exodeoxyribonuclease-5